jgi:hypothetical protein
MGTIVEGPAKAKIEGTEARWCVDAKLIEGIKNATSLLFPPCMDACIEHRVYSLLLSQITKQ